MWYISYLYGMIEPVCAEIAVKHQLLASESRREGSDAPSLFWSLSS